MGLEERWKCGSGVLISIRTEGKGFGGRRSNFLNGPSEVSRQESPAGGKNPPLFLVAGYVGWNEHHFRHEILHTTAAMTDLHESLLQIPKSDAAPSMITRITLVFSLRSHWLPFSHYKVRKA